MKAFAHSIDSRGFGPSFSFRLHSIRRSLADRELVSGAAVEHRRHHSRSVSVRISASYWC